MPADVDELAAMAAAECEPGSDAAGSAAYRRHLVRTLFARMLHDDIDQATRSAA
jgi:CO/xanthine dehydrogenase FAD-binding subunit